MLSLSFWLGLIIFLHLGSFSGSEGFEQVSILRENVVVEVWSPSPLSQELDEEGQGFGFWKWEVLDLGVGLTMSESFGLPHPHPLLAVNMLLSSSFLLEDIVEKREIYELGGFCR